VAARRRSEAVPTQLPPQAAQPSRRHRAEIDRTQTISYSKLLYRQRNCIERALGPLTINHAIAVRYDQLADSFLGMPYLATAR
jgi:hypothetical protein